MSFNSVAPWVKGRLQPEPLASRVVYKTLFKHAPIYMATCMTAALIGGLAFDAALDKAWDINNKGVSNLPTYNLQRLLATDLLSGGSYLSHNDAARLSCPVWCCIET